LGPLVLGVVFALLWLWPLAAIRVANSRTEVTQVVVEGFQATPTSGLLMSSGESDTLLIAAHGGLANRNTMMAFCYEANARGADCLTFDLMGHGASSTEITDLQEPRCEDATRVLHDAVEEVRVLGLKGKRYATVGYVGHSLGAALLCEMEVQNVAFVGFVCQATPGRTVRGPPAVTLPFGEVEIPQMVGHVLEPWTPVVVDRAVKVSLGADAKSAGPRQDLTALMPLVSLLGGFLFASWLSLGLVRRILAAGQVVGVSRQVGAGVVAALVYVIVFAVTGWRTLWFPALVQGSDVAILGLVVLPGLGLFLIWRVLWSGVQRLLSRWSWTTKLASWTDSGAAVALGVAPGVALAWAMSARWTAGGWCPGGAVMGVLPGVALVGLAPLMGFAFLRSVVAPKQWTSWVTVILLSLCLGYGVALLTPAVPVRLLPEAVELILQVLIQPLRGVDG